MFTFIGVVSPAGQGSSSPLVLGSTAMILLEPAVRAVLGCKGVNSLLFGFPVAPLVELLHEHILPQYRSILLIPSLRSHTRFMRLLGHRSVAQPVP